MSNAKPIIYTDDFFKNINRKLRRNKLPKDTLYNAVNLRYDEEYGSLQKRLGRARYNQTSIGTSVIHDQHRYYKNSTGSAALIIGYESAIKIGYDAQGVFSDLKTGISTSLLSFLTYKDLEYIVNGSDANMVFGLTSKTSPVENMGVPSITAPSGTVSAVAGNLLGSVYYAVSQQLDGYQEGNVSPSSAAVNVNGSQCTVTIPTSANSRATGRYLYRTKSSASTLYRLVAISDNTTISYIDNIADTSLDTTITGPINYGVPAAYKLMLLHDERIFLARNRTYKSRIIFSDIRDGTSYPDVFPANNRLDIARDDGDEITAIKEDQFGQFIVFKENSIRLIQTSSGSPDAWGISDPLSNQGCIAPYSAVTTPIGIVYLTRYGQQRKRLVLWNGQNTVLIPELEGVEPILSDIPTTSLGKLKAHYHNGYYYLAYRDTLSGGTYPNKVMVIDIYNGWSVSIDDKNIASFSSWNGGSDLGQLYTGTSDSTGFVKREDTETYDFLIRQKSEFDRGSLSNTDTAGTENTPSLTLSSSVNTQIGARTWASMSGTADTWGSLSAYNQLWWLNGEWVDSIQEISADALTSLLWFENKPDDTEVLTYIRTGDSEAAVEAAGWSGPYSTPGGSDISGVTAGKYVQLKAQLFAKNYANYSAVSIYRQGTTDTDYAMKISVSYGSPDETTIEFDMESRRIDLGDVNEAFKRLRKRLRSVRIEYEAGSATGSFDFSWYFDGATPSAGTFNTSYTTFSEARTYNFPLTNICDRDWFYRIYSNTDTAKLKIQRIIFTVSVEPYRILQKNLISN